MSLVERGSIPRPGRRRFRFSVRAAAAASAVVAIALGLYVRRVERSLGQVMVGIKNFIAVDFQVVDEEGTPIPAAEVRSVFLLPDGKDGYESLAEALRPSSSWTRDDGWIRIHAIGDYRRLRYRGAFGLLPIAGSPEVVFLRPYDGVRIQAAGYKPWTRRFEDLRRESGVRLPLGGVLPPVVVRLKGDDHHPAGAAPDR